MNSCVEKTRQKDDQVVHFKGTLAIYFRQEATGAAASQKLTSAAAAERVAAETENKTWQELKLFLEFCFVGGKLYKEECLSCMSEK